MAGRGENKSATKSKAPKRRRSTKKAKRAVVSSPPEPPVELPEDNDADHEFSPVGARRLDAILRALPAKELKALIGRIGIRVDKRKRIDAAAQVARALVRLPDVREPSRLPPVSAELLRRIAESNGSLMSTALPAGLEVLVRRGIVYAHMSDQGIELMLPTAFLVQMKSWEGEDPRSLRALLAEAPFETASAIASHYLGRPSTPPIALSLEPAWEVLGDLDGLRGELDRVSLQERRLLEQIERVGGEVDTQELMDLEREPMRVRGVYGVAAGRRGAAFSLEKRGLVFPVHPNRYVLPTEVMAIIGADGRRQREERRDQIRAHVFEEDHLPRRAKFSKEPAPFALALTMELRDSGQDVKPGVGTPRSLVARLAQRFGSEVEPTALIAALSRAAGLWESGGVNTATPPGSLKLWELSGVLFGIWRRGGAWDEARRDSETLRVAPEHRDASPVGTLREMVLDALVDLGEEQWVACSELVAYLEEDPRMRGLERLFHRWSTRVGLSTPSPIAVAERVLLESLPALGVVDLGGADVKAAASTGEVTKLAIRLTTRGRRFIANEPAMARGEESGELIKPRRLRVGSASLVAEVLELTGFTDIAAVESALELTVSGGSVARGLAGGIQASEMRDRLATIAPLSDALENALEQAGMVIGTATYSAASGFLWVEDQDVRQLLGTGSSTRDLFVDSSPPGGLLVGAGVDPERLLRRCRAVGVDIEIDESVMRVRHSTMPPPKKSDTRKKTVSWRPPVTKSRKRKTGSR